MRSLRQFSCNLISIILPAIVFGGTWPLSPQSSNAAETDAPLRVAAIRELKQALEHESRWLKVHAAEALLALGIDNRAAALFEEELKQHRDEPEYRIGIRRVLFRASADSSERSQQLEAIRNIYFDEAATDRGHAAETLAKLEYAVSIEVRPQVRSFAQDSTDSNAPFHRWMLANSGDANDARFLAELLDSSDPAIRSGTAYALRHLASKLPRDVVDTLATAAKTDPAAQPQAYLISAAYVTAPDADHKSQFKRQLLQFAHSGNKDEKYEVAAALAARGTSEDLPLLMELLHDPEADVRVSAANAILHINPQRTSFHWLDWGVILAYFLGMLAIGWWYSRSTTVEQYQLGGRELKPWAIGISLFASLASALTFLALPGEMIHHGPMILSAVLAYPLVYLVVGRYMIPRIMRLKVTSAYEILELRFGLSVRLLGSAIFLAIRLLWMALMLYAMADAILVPLMGLPTSATPWVCIALALVTITYTSMGGFQAVVVIDVIQTFIMLTGAIISITAISYSLGGVSEWWPRTWSADWDKPSFLFATDSRVSMGMAIVATFTWYVCTAGSDQIVIQRYLSTRNAAPARKMFGISLVCDACVTLLLAALGLALLAYFNIHRDLLPRGETVSSSADELLPLFIVKVLPAGLSGLVVAGVLSAAMDSLSSGLNSSAVVVTEDWIDRFRNTALTEQKQVAQAKLVSLALGIVVILMSLCTGYVSGNLMEMIYKVVNLLTSPLFVLFFMAMFVPWATTLGTWVAGVTSTAMAIAIAFFDFGGLSFIWIMPASLVVGIVFGCTASLLPVGISRPMLQLNEHRPNQQ